MANLVNPIRTNPFMPIIGYDIPSLGGAFACDGLSDTGNFDARRVFAPPPYTTEIDNALLTRNLDWHSETETVNYRGPYNRYFWTSTQSNGSPVITRKGRFWTQAPFTNMDIFGACVSTFGLSKYCTICCGQYSSGKWIVFIYQRPFAETYTSHTWPGDWTRAGFYRPVDQGLATPLPATIFPFNASGTECRGFFGNLRSDGSVSPEKQIIITIGQGTASFAEIENGSGNEHPTVQTNNGTVQYNIVTGNQPSPPCGNVEEVGGFKDYKITSDGVETLDISTTQLGNPCYVAADYIGNTLVLAELKNEIVHTINRTNVVVQDIATASGVPTKDDQTQDYDDTGNDYRHTSITSSTINIVLSETISTYTGALDGASSLGSPMQYTGQYDSQYKTTDRKIAYMDLRTGTIVYHESIIDTVKDQTISGPSTVNQPYNSQTNSQHRYVGKFAGLDVVFFNLENTVDDSGSGDFPTDIESAVCPSWNYDNSYTNAGTYYFGIHPSLFVRGTTWLGTGVIVHASEVGGNSVFCSPKYERTLVSAWAQVSGEYVHYLTDADIMVLLNNTGTNPRLFMADLIDWNNAYG